MINWFIFILQYELGLYVTPVSLPRGEVCTPFVILCATLYATAISRLVNLLITLSHYHVVVVLCRQEQEIGKSIFMLSSRLFVVGLWLIVQFNSWRVIWYLLWLRVYVLVEISSLRFDTWDRATRCEPYPERCFTYNFGCYEEDYLKHVGPTSIRPVSSVYRGLVGTSLKVTGLFNDDRVWSVLLYY